MLYGELLHSYVHTPAQYTLVTSDIVYLDSLVPWAANYSRVIKLDARDACKTRQKYDRLCSSVKSTYRNYSIWEGLKPGIEQNRTKPEVIVVQYGHGCWTRGQKLALIIQNSFSVCMDSDLAFCNSYEDGTSTNREPRQAYKTAEVGHSQLQAQQERIRMGD